ncbi:hypothetical protein, partial [Klebsiella pneumoniae]|uniref:hypothetical protein n=1 Tax=Klebsiella pneumoniae TaxID=573 RepID=UPI0025A1B0E9
NNAARARTLQQTGAMSTSQINQYLTQEKTAQAATARVSPAPASTVRTPMRASTAQSPASASTAATSGVAAASAPLRELACRALESDRR